jgi:hypothetical protein
MLLVRPRSRAPTQLKVRLATGSYLVLSDVPSDSLLARKNIAVGDAILTVRRLFE